MTWIPVDERLPDRFAPVLTVDHEGGIWICKFIRTRDNVPPLWECCATGQRDDSITHWQPLPEPPTKD